MTTPVRRQYLQLKLQHPDAILFFRMGDFYEAFDEDAQRIAQILNIVLTAREVGGGQKVPMAGVPHHAAESYIARLIKAGYKVAICEQVDKNNKSDKPAGKGLMDREVVRVITPVYPNEELAQAEKRLQAFTQEIVPVLNEFLPK